MDYRKAGERIVLRLDEDDEVVSSIIDVCKKEHVKAASVRGIGALKKVELSHYDSIIKEYTTNTYDGMFEITSMSGNISQLAGNPAAHIHINLGRTDLTVFGGHLVSARVNPTCEIFITPVELELSREKDEKTGLSLLRFG
jgi:predicted DNA-binding protein with PD1-like motif